MPKIHVTRSQQVPAPAGEVFAIVRDFKQWRPWSPWLIAEPACEVTYPQDGSGYAWDGEIVGAGKMEVVADKQGESMTTKLNFIKPFKSEADVTFTFTENDGGTEVTWSMDSSLPFFMFFFKGMMESFIGMDYERGLLMLQEYAETGEVSSGLEFPGVENFAGCRFVGIRREAPMAEMAEAMGGDFGRVNQWVEGSGAEPAGKPLSIYHKWNPVKRIAEYTAAIPVSGSPGELPDGLVEGAVPACRTYPVKHTGPYRYLGNAWASGIMHSRAKRFKKLNSIAPFEIYENDPAETAEKDLVTVVRFAAK